MPELSLQNIEQISRDIRKQEISFSHLLDELTDHVCCDVENEMQNGMNFQDAYRMVEQKMGNRRLKEIQEETLYSVDTKYRQMKNTMKISGIAGTIMLGFASLFKIMHWPGAGILLVLGALTLAFIFMPSALGVLWKETHNSKRLILYISAFLTGMFFIMGVLFKIQHWPGAGLILTLATLSAILFFIPALTIVRFRDPENKSKRSIYLLGSAGLIFCIAGMLFKIQHWPMATILMMLGLLILFIIVFPWYTWISWKEEKNVSAMFIFLVVGSISLIVPSTIINLNLQRSYSDGYFINQRQEQELYKYLYLNNQSFLTKHKDSESFSTMEQLHSKTNDLLNQINDVEFKTIAEFEGKPGEPKLNPQWIRQTESGPEIDFRLLNRPFQFDFLLPGTPGRVKIEAAMAAYKNYITGLDSIPQLKKYELVLSPSVFFPSNDPNAGRITMMTGLHSLVLLKNSILTVESGILLGLASR